MHKNTPGWIVGGIGSRMGCIPESSDEEEIC
jgi:hypothetical protein